MKTRGRDSYINALQSHTNERSHDECLWPYLSSSLVCVVVVVHTLLVVVWVWGVVAQLCLFVCVCENGGMFFVICLYVVKGSQG